ncbi:MAG: hydroxymethylbilane synthase [Chloroflexi bacterium]|nr:hydroxymethylbilane synthase [Chloroflexota bacterium]
MTRTKITIGSRGSKLALIQAESVVARLSKLHPHLDVEVRKVVTEGDRNRQVKLEQVSSIGIFVKELEKALLNGRIDLAVHSLKDVPTEIPPELCLLAVVEREDPRDVLIAKTRLADLPSGARIGTGSLRRAVQLTHFRADLVPQSIRGNVTTRVGKVTSGALDGVILAAAALQRLGWEDRITEYLPTNVFLPSPGQGAIVVEARQDDGAVAALVAPLNHLPTWQSVMAERAFLRALGGGCRAPIAALGTVTNGVLHLDGMIADTEGKRMLRTTTKGDATIPEALGVVLAQRLIGMGADAFVAQAKAR